MSKYCSKANLIKNHLQKKNRSKLDVTSTIIFLKKQSDQKIIAMHYHWLLEQWFPTGVPPIVAIP